MLPLDPIRFSFTKHWDFDVIRIEAWNVFKTVHFWRKKTFLFLFRFLHDLLVSVDHLSYSEFLSSLQISASSLIESLYSNDLKDSHQFCQTNYQNRLVLTFNLVLTYSKSGSLCLGNWMTKFCQVNLPT